MIASQLKNKTTTTHTIGYMQTTYTTPRLHLVELTVKDADFIIELVNSQEWIRFIGHRNVNTVEQATAYIQKILNNTNTHYWVIKTKDENISIGVVTLMKRDYLAHWDIGFALLPHHTGKGYAYEATDVVLKSIINNPAHEQVLATTLKTNIRSIALLEKLGLSYANEIVVNAEPLSMYAMKPNPLAQ
jgi:RimJ/RimL family protein N-acetyltransferase